MSAPWMMAPVLLPMWAGILALLAGQNRPGLQRVIGLSATALLVPLSLLLYRHAAGGEISVCALGNWPAPFGIVLVLDRLAAVMLVLVAVLALPALCYAGCGDDRAGRHFHALFQFQLMGLNGAFLTGDLFNLFVFFEVLLVASYGLALHGGGAQRVRAGLHYVVLNLVGSALFLLALALIYGATGTLNMADLAVRAEALAGPPAALLAVACLLLGVVFALKAALFPLYFWLPATYAGATAGVAALFAVMTKVGVYAIARVFGLLADPLLMSVLWVMALVTMPLAAFGVLAAGRLRDQAGYLVILSVATLMAALAWGGPTAFSAVLFYTVHSTLIGAGLFLLADLVGRARGGAGDALAGGALPRHGAALGLLFFAAAVAVIGLPPLSGFVAKLALLQAVPSPWYWTLVLVTGLLVLIGLSRAGTSVFWRAEGGRAGGPDEASGAATPEGLRWLAVLVLLAAGPLLAVLGAPLLAVTDAAAHQWARPALYIDAVLGPAGARP